MNTLNATRDANYAQWWASRGRFLGVSPKTAREIFCAGFSARHDPEPMYRRFEDSHLEETIFIGEHA